MRENEFAGLATRDRILAAAAAMIGEDPSATLSVRAVAARAVVSTGSLRYQFPTQRALRETVLARIYEHVVSDDRIHDRSLPARERLIGSLRQVLAPAGVGEQARAAWRTVHEAFIDPEPTSAGRAAYLAMDREAHRRVEYWLTVLSEEGALAEGDNARRARFLLTVIDGLSVERALPADDSILTAESETLIMAVDAVFSDRPR